MRLLSINTIFIQFSCSVAYNSLWPHGPQHTRPACPSPTPGACSNSYLSNWWCHPAISSPLIPFSILPMNIQDWFPLGWTGWISLLSKGRSRQHHSSKSSILQPSAFFMVQLSHPYMTTRKTIALTRWTFVEKVTSLLFNMLSRLVITFLPGSKCLLISWLQSPSAVILEPKKVKCLTVSIVSPCICHEAMGSDAMIFVFWMLSFKPTFLLSSFTFIKRLFSSSSLSAIRMLSSAYLRLLIFLPAILIPACASHDVLCI